MPLSLVLHSILCESKKVCMAKDSILDVLCLCTSLLRNLYKEGKHTFVAKQAWVALDFV